MMGLFVNGKTFITLLALFTMMSVPVMAGAGVATEVPVDKSILINLKKPSERVSIANPNIAELVVISPSQLQINGTRIGTTSLIVWEKGGGTSFFDIRVKGDVSLLENQIREIAPNDSITVDYANDTIVLSGKAANEQTVAKVVQLANAYAAEKTGNPGHNQEQQAYSPGDGSRGLYEPKGGNDSKLKVLNHIEIDDPQQVLLEVKVAQVDKTALKSLGLSGLNRGNSGEGFLNLVGAPDSKTFHINPPGIAGDFPFIGAISPLGPYQIGVSLFKPGIGAVLRALVTKNLAKVLAEPNLLVKSGQEGRFLAGTKIPISVVTGVGALSGTEIRFIDIGVKLNFKPEVMENGLISLKIDPAEVSNITGTLAVNGYPIIDTREVRTSVRLKDGESLVLAGLLQEETIKTMSKIPLIGDIPILGALFRSTQDDLREKELVFFITPRLASRTAPGKEPELPTDKPLTQEQERELEWMPLGH